MELSGEFQITGWDETTISESDDGSKSTQATVTQNYSGALEGHSSVQYLMQYQSAQLAQFVGFETLDVQVNGKAGRFILQHQGVFKDGVAQSESTIVAGSGKGACEGYAGTCSFKSKSGGKADYCLLLG